LKTYSLPIEITAQVRVMEDERSTIVEKKVVEEKSDNLVTTPQHRSGSSEVIEPEAYAEVDIQPSEQDSSSLASSAELGVSKVDNQSRRDLDDPEKDSDDVKGIEAEQIDQHDSSNYASKFQLSDSLSSEKAVKTVCSTAEDSKDSDTTPSSMEHRISPGEEAYHSDSSEAGSSSSSSASSSEEDPDDVVAGPPTSDSNVAPDVSLNTDGATGGGHVSDKLAEFTPSEAPLESGDMDGSLPPVIDSLEDFYSNDTSSDDDDNERSLSLRAPSLTTKKTLSVPQKSVKSTRETSKKLRSSHDKAKKKKRRKDKNEDTKEVSPPLTTAQVGMIRYSAMASEHIGEMRNPRVGELPSRTTAIPEQPMRYMPKPAVDAAVAAAASLPRVFQSTSGYWGFSGHDDNISEYETDTDTEDSADGSGEIDKKSEAGKADRVLDENETFFGLVTSGLDTVLEPVGGLGKIQSALPAGLVSETPGEQKYDDVEDGPSGDNEKGKSGSSAENLNEASSSSTEGLRSRKSDDVNPKPKKMRRKKRPPPNPTRPLDDTEVRITHLT